MSPHDRLTDQIVFRWDTDNLSGTTGFGPVAWSCAPETADAVFRSTAPLLRATGEATAPALLRLESGDRVLLVRRAPWRDAGGRAGTVCHALMGPAPVLDPATCLGLYDWSWKGGDLPLAEVRGVLPPVPEAALLPAADSGQRHLTGGLAGVGRELVGAVAEFLRHRNAGFTFLDPSGDAACRVLWGLYGIFGGHNPRRWTFATHDTAESERLRFVFVSRWTGETSGSGARRRSDPAERCGDRAELVAEQLVRHQLREEYEVGAALRRAADHHRATRGGPLPLLDLAESALSALPPAPRPRRAPAPPPTPGPGRDRHGTGDGRAPYGPGAGPDPYGPVTGTDLYGAGNRPDPHRPGDGRDAYAPGAGPGPYEPGAAQAGASADGRPYAVGGAVPDPLGAPEDGPYAPAAAPRQSPPVRVVAPEWPAPSEDPPRARGWRDRRGGSSHRRGRADEELLRALRAGGGYGTLTALVTDAAERWPSWGREQRAALCSVLLDQELYVTDRAGAGMPGDEVRAANAASLYRWAVRPLLDDPALAARVTELLPRLYTGPYRAARAAVDQIARGRAPGLPEPAWQALFRSATRTPPTPQRPPTPRHPPGPAPQPRPPGQGDAGAPPPEDGRDAWTAGDTAGHRPAGSPPRRDAPRTAGAHRPRGGGDPPAHRPPRHRDADAAPRGPEPGRYAPRRSPDAPPGAAPRGEPGRTPQDRPWHDAPDRPSAPPGRGAVDRPPDPPSQGPGDRPPRYRDADGRPPGDPSRYEDTPRPAPRVLPEDPPGEPGRTEEGGGHGDEPPYGDGRSPAHADRPRTARADRAPDASPYEESPGPTRPHRTGRTEAAAEEGTATIPRQDPRPRGEPPRDGNTTRRPAAPPPDERRPATPPPPPAGGPPAGGPAAVGPDPGGREARGGAGPPQRDSAGKGPFVVFGVGTGVILALLGTLLVLTLRGCG
ncbi:hypothetical protein [Streptomyces thermolilacinus]|uniref:Uncharacterized protein n=1 Tax=Streptomyces thermolilacinus SPC6 TaxID=1306406 RepID=A0A1D3DNJ4_9ACTN|nr:hypothetical protein [Streptomyces thermolilacinus]OEJ93893.1 hypothetical protein J116_004810 [Streptomyces thermolilacinus SPC6]